MKRFTVYTVLATMLLTACGQGSDETSTQAVTQTSQTTEAVSETELHDNVPELDFGGEQMTFAVMEPWEYEFDVASATGEITNDATYNRNALMEERFHVVIDTVL